MRLFIRSNELFSRVPKGYALKLEPRPAQQLAEVVEAARDARAEHELRTGDPGQSALLVNQHPISGVDWKLTALSFTFQYVLGDGDSTAQAPNISLVVLNAADVTEYRTCIVQ